MFLGNDVGDFGAGLVGGRRRGCRVLTGGDGILGIIGGIGGDFLGGV